MSLHKHKTSNPDIAEMHYHKYSCIRVTNSDTLSNAVFQQLQVNITVSASHVVTNKFEIMTSMCQRQCIFVRRHKRAPTYCKCYEWQISYILFKSYLFRSINSPLRIIIQGVRIGPRVSCKT